MSYPRESEGTIPESRRCRDTSFYTREAEGCGGEISSGAESESSEQKENDSEDSSFCEAFSSKKKREVLRWYRELVRSSNEVYLPLYFDRHRYLVLMGGGGSGKSHFAGRKLLERALHESGHRFLCVRKIAKTLRQSCVEQLLRQLGEHYPDARYEYKSSDGRIVFENGSEILFMGLDDREKIKSICSITGIWCEEASELDEQDFAQLDIRLRGESRFYKQIILSFNPISVTHWLKRRFFDIPDKRALTLRTTYRDNRFLDEEAKTTLESFRDTDRYYYSVYCLGEWGVAKQSIFPSEQLLYQLERAKPPLFYGEFDYSESGGKINSYTLESISGGALEVYCEPERDCHYVIGVDTAGSGGDYSVAFVINNCTGRQAALMRARMPEDIFVRQLYCLGRYYRDALIAVETNYSTYFTLELQRLGYPKQYLRQGEDYSQTLGRRFGFYTDSRTRPLIISDLVRAFRAEPEIICDRQTLSEMSSFVRDENLRVAAAPGCHDDCVMAAAIANFARSQQQYSRVVSVREINGWSRSLKEDYRRATAAERQYLREKYGRTRM